MPDVKQSDNNITKPENYKNLDQEKQGKPMTRRSVIKWLFLTVIAIITVCHVLLKRNNGSSKKGSFEILNQFDPEKNLTVTPAQLGMSNVCGPIEILAITSFAELQPYSFGITYAFHGKEDPEKRVQMEIVAQDKSGNVVQTFSRIVEDPRILAKREGRWKEGDPPFNLRGRLTLEIEGENILHQIKCFIISCNSFEI